MKRNDSGYVLPYVLVVMVVLCLVAVSIMSSTLRNLQVQQATWQRMQDRYAAEGKIEAVMAQLNKLKIESTEKEAKNAFDTEIPKLCPEGTTLTGSYTSLDDKKFEYKIELLTAVNTATISCKASISGTIDTQEESVPESLEKKYIYTVTNSKITCDTYEITYGGGAE